MLPEQALPATPTIEGDDELARLRRERDAAYQAVADVLKAVPELIRCERIDLLNAFGWRSRHAIVIAAAQNWATTVAAASGGGGHEPGQPGEPGAVLTRRYMDEIDAAAAGRDWLDAVRRRRCPNYPVEIEQIDLHRPDNGVKLDGGLLLMWGYAGRLVAQVTIIRDDANFSIVTGLEYPSAAAGGPTDDNEDDLA